MTASVSGACRECGGKTWVAGTNEYGRPNLRCAGCGRTRTRPRGPGERPTPPPPRLTDACRYCPTVKARHLVQLPGRHRYGAASAVCDACLARLVPSAVTP